MAEIVKMDENTWRIEDGFVRFFLLAGTEKAAMIDSGVNCPNAKELAESLTKLPIMLINTHGDGDHTSGTAAFDRIYMHKEDHVNCGLAERYPDTALKSVADGDTFDLGGRTLKIIENPGHTKGSIAILDVEKRVLYAGDAVQKGTVYMFGDKRAPERYEASLEKLAAMSGEYDTIVASHDEPVLPNDYAQKVLEGWREVKAGTAPYEERNLFGAVVRQYTTKHCGFYYGA